MPLKRVGHTFRTGFVPGTPGISSAYRRLLTIAGARLPEFTCGIEKLASDPARSLTSIRLRFEDEPHTASALNSDPVGIINDPGGWDGVNASHQGASAGYPPLFDRVRGKFRLSSAAGVCASVAKSIS